MPSGRTLLNQRFLPQLLAGEDGVQKLRALVRTHFRMGGHHIQFNVVDGATLRDAQAHPERYRDLLVRVAGHSDYFVDIGHDLQEETIARTTQGEGWGAGRALSLLTPYAQLASVADYTPGRRRGN